jgi:signal peptidase II
MHTTTTRRIALIGCLVIVIDQLTKQTAVLIAQGRRSGPLVPTTNHQFSLGVAGTGLTFTVVLAAMGIVAAGVYTWRLARQGGLPGWVPALLVGGAISNLLDRLLTGAVHDFIATPWVVFNLADLAVLAAVVGWIRHPHWTPLDIKVQAASNRELDSTSRRNGCGNAR